MALGAQVRALRNARGWTLEKLADASGVDVGTINALENRNSKRSMYTEALAKGFGLSVDELLAGSAKSPGSESNAEEARDIRRPVRVAVVGHVKGGDDGYLEEMQYPTGSGEGYVEYWTKDKGAYALRIKGDSMHPRYRAGEFVVVTPNVEAQPGQDVVVKLANGRKLLKQLNWVRGDELQLLSINNGYAPITLSLEEIESIHRVAGSVSSDAFIEP